MSETNLASQELLIGGDFSALWSAAKLFIEGKSIYQQSEFFPLYDSIAAGYIGPGPIYYPPWLLALVWPFGFASWEASLYVWLCLNFALLFSLPFLVAKLLYARSPLRSELFLIPLLLPCLYALKLGQISLLLLFFALASLVYLKARRTFFAGLLLSIVLIKPHLVWLTFLILPAIISRGELFRFSVGVVLGFISLNLPTLLFQPSLYTEFFSFSQDPLRWRALSLVTLFRESEFILQLAIVLLFIGVLAFVFRMVSSDPLKKSSWAALLLLLALCPLFSPYAWISDYVSLTLLTPIFLLKRSWSIALFSLNALALYQAVYFRADYSLLWFVALVSLLGVWAVGSSMQLGSWADSASSR